MIACQSRSGSFLNHEPHPLYYIIIGESNFHDNGYNHIITVKNRREVELLLLSLGEEAAIIMDEETRQRSNDWDWLYGRTIAEICANLKWSYREEEENEIINIIRKIPLPRTIYNSFLKLNKNDPEPEPIGREFVHKTNKECVLISIPYRCGNMFYFNGFNKPTVLNSDHHSDHLEGILIFELACQAGLAAAHLVGLPFFGNTVILKTIIKFIKFIENDEPLLIRTIPAYHHRRGIGFCAFEIFQSNRSCSVGYLSGILYKS